MGTVTTEQGVSGKRHNFSRPVRRWQLLCPGVLGASALNPFPLGREAYVQLQSSPAPHLGPKTGGQTALSRPMGASPEAPITAMTNVGEPGQTPRPTPPSGSQRPCGEPALHRTHLQRALGSCWP